MEKNFFDVIFRTRYQKFTPLSIFLLLVYIFLLIKTAWMHEDAFITYATVNNFLDGYGLRYNISERVQSYTSPLMMLCMSLFSLFWREPFFMTVTMNMLMSFTAVFVFVFFI